MEKINKGDFIELEYTGRLKETNEVFDTTDEKLAKETGIYQKGIEYGPVIICVGENFTLQGLEENIIGKELGEYKIELPPEKAFGKKDAKLIKMIPFVKFKEQKIMPEPGMQINVDGATGIIKTAKGGRCLVDFNHPISGNEVVYDIKINRIVSNDAEKIKGFLELTLKIKSDVEIKEQTAEITAEKEIPEQLHKTIEEKLKKLIPSVKNIKFLKKKKQDIKPEENSSQEKENKDNKNKEAENKENKNIENN